MQNSKSSICLVLATMCHVSQSCCFSQTKSNDHFSCSCCCCCCSLVTKFEICGTYIPHFPLPISALLPPSTLLGIGFRSPGLPESDPKFLTRTRQRRKTTNYFNVCFSCLAMHVWPIYTLDPSTSLWRLDGYVTNFRENSTSFPRHRLPRPGQTKHTNVQS